MRHSHLLVMILFILLLGVSVSCTSSNFSGVGKTAGSKKDDSDDDVEYHQDDDDDSDFIDLEEGGSKIVENDDGTVLEIHKASVPEYKVDIIFLVDSSGSMDDEIARLEANINNFLNRFIDEQGELDYQIFLIAGENDNDFHFPVNVTGHPQVEHIDRTYGVASSNALGIARDFMVGTLASNKLQLRDDAGKEFVFITDDNAEADKYDTKTKDRGGISLADFQSFISERQDKELLHFNGIVGLPTSNQGGGCEIAKNGSAYITLSEMPMHKGLMLDLCNQDWNGLLNELAGGIIDRAEFRFKLKYTPGDTDSIEVTVDGEPVPASNIRWISSSNEVAIRVDPAPADGARVKIIYVK